MKQKTIATRHLRTKIAAGYVLILFVIFGIVYIWLNEQNRQQELEATTYKIRSLRKDVHEVYIIKSRFYLSSSKSFYLCES